jgi:hypothetical protein
MSLPRRGPAWQSKARLGKAGCGAAGMGMARNGKARKLINERQRDREACA